LKSERRTGKDSSATRSEAGSAPT